MNSNNNEKLRIPLTLHMPSYRELFWFILLNEASRMQQTLSDCELLHNVKLHPSQSHTLTPSHLQGMPWMAKLSSDNLKDSSLHIGQNILRVCQYNAKKTPCSNTLEESWGSASNLLFFFPPKNT